MGEGGRRLLGEGGMGRDGSRLYSRDAPLKNSLETAYLNLKTGRKLPEKSAQKDPGSNKSVLGLGQVFKYYHGCLHSIFFLSFFMIRTM